MKIATQEEIDQEEARKKAQAQEFINVPLNQIVVSQQVRQNIDTTAESFKALMESIRARGVLEPVLAVLDSKVHPIGALNWLFLPCPDLEQEDSQGEVTALSPFDWLRRHLDPAPILAIAPELGELF